MSWLSAVPLALIAVAALYLSGGVLAGAAGARGKLLLVTAPAVTISALAVFAMIFGEVGIPWRASTALAAVILVAAIVWCGRRLLAGRWGAPSARARASVPRWVYVAAAGLAALVITIQIVISYGEIDNVSQTYDAPFHLNGIRYIIETANGSSLHLTSLILPEGRSTFYPAGWHDLVSLVAMIMPGADVVAAANITNLVIAAVVWPINVLVMISVLAPRNKVAILAGGVLSTAFPAFPLGMIDYGVLYPYFLALAFIPAGIALGASVLRLQPESNFGPLPLQWLGVVAVVGAIGFGQPSLVFAFAALALVGVVTVGWRAVRKSQRASAMALFVAGVFVIGVGFALVWRKVGALGYNAPWGPYGSLPEVLLDTFTLSRGGRSLAIALGILVILGLVAEIRRRRLWLVGMWLVPALLFVFSGTLPRGDLRNLLLGLFYKDTPRFEALLVPLSLMVAVVGCCFVWDLLGVMRERYAWSSRARSSVGIVLLVAVFVAVQAVPMRDEVTRASDKYRLTMDSQILDADERELIEKLDSLVPEDAVIAGSPWTGTSWAYALADRMVSNPHFNATSDANEVLINQHLADALTMPEVCEALDATGVRYVLDFGVEKFGGRITVDTSYGYEGLVDLQQSGVVREAARVGDKVLYEITACGL